MYLINSNSLNNTQKDKNERYPPNLEFVIVYPVFSIIVYSYSYKDRNYLGTEHNFEYLNLLDLYYDIKIINNNSGNITNCLRNVSAVNFQSYLGLIIQSYKKQGRKCSSEELLGIFLNIKDNVLYPNNL